MRSCLRACPAVLLLALLPVSACSGSDGEAPPARSGSADVVTDEPSEPPEQPEQPEPSGPSIPSLPEGEQALTFENSRDLAILLEGPETGRSVGRFASRNEGAAIELDAHVVAVTADAVLLEYGDHDAARRTGPVFEVEVVEPAALGLEGDLVEDDDVRLVARVGSYEPDVKRLLLDPVSITRRG